MLNSNLVRRDEFGRGSPGQLLRINGGVAFLPNTLPPDVHVTWELAAHLERATRCLARLDGQASLIQNRMLIVRPLLTREAVESARLEGTHTHITGVLRQEAEVPPSDPAEASNNQEVINYLRTSQDGERWITDGRPVNLQLLRSLHDVLLRGTRGEGQRPGQFRLIQVLIGAHGDSPANARFVPPPPEHVQPAMENLVSFMADSVPYGPLIAAGIAHYQFDAVHPFEDGNGRLGRLLIPLQLMASEAISHPLVYLSTYFEPRRDEYLRLLKLVSTAGDWHAWLTFFLNAVQAQADDARSRVERIVALHDEYRDKASRAGRSRMPALVVDLVMERLFLTAGAVASHFECDYSTAKSALEALTRLGIVVPVADTYPQRWWAQDLIQKVYES